MQSAHQSVFPGGSQWCSGSGKFVMNGSLTLSLVDFTVAHVVALFTEGTGDHRQVTLNDVHLSTYGWQQAIPRVA